ncbi:MAG: phosphate/phosphite/phosphonate ABC transporter substrate-binding protein [Sulfuricaulis sp.]
MFTRKKILVVGLLSLVLAAPPAFAALVLTSPPRESRAKGIEVYQPIADFLSKVTGQKIIYQYPDNWLLYQQDMRKGKYDIIFDGPAFVGWRIDKLGHTPLVKLPGKMVFMVVVKKDQNKIQSLKELEGHTICAFPPPNLATLTVLFEFDNPVRQPLIMEIHNFQGAYKGVLGGKCSAAIFPKKKFEQLSGELGGTKVIFTSKPISNQAFTASPRVSPELQDKIAKALLSPEGEVATQKLRGEFNVKDFVPATKDEYMGLGKFLRDTWGFESK